MDLKKRQPIGVELVKRGIIDEEDIERALDYQRQHPEIKIGDCLYELDVCDPYTLITAIGEILGERGILLSKNSIRIDIEEYISLDIAKKNKAVPFEIESGKIKVCFANTVNRRSIETIRLLFLNKGLIMETYITFEKDITKILKSLEGKANADIHKSGVTVINLVDSIIKTGIEKRASDIHIEPMANSIRVRYRIDGELFTEVMVVDNIVAGIIRKEKLSVSEIEDAIQSNLEKGSIGLMNSLAELFVKDQITLEQAKSQIEEKNQEILNRTIMQLKIRKSSSNL